jgi:hypothetical protein
VGFLASLLPGVRHLRAPLAAGYLWLLSAWIFLHDDVKQASDEGAVAAFGELRNELSVAAVGVAVSFGAFIAGALTQPVGMAIPLYIARVYRALRVEEGYYLPAELSVRRAKLLREMELRQIQDLADAMPHFPLGEWLEKELQGTRLAEAVVREDLPLIHRRLAGNEATTELFAEIDRTQSEAELRLAVWLPLAVAMVAFAGSQWGWDSAWIAAPAAVAVATALAVQGIRRLRAANDTLIDVVRLGTGEQTAFPTFLQIAASARREEQKQRPPEEEAHIY